jgi:hypothetical protein
MWAEENAFHFIDICIINLMWLYKIPTYRCCNSKNCWLPLWSSWLDDQLVISRTWTNKTFAFWLSKLKMNHLYWKQTESINQPIRSNSTVRERLFFIPLIHWRTRPSTSSILTSSVIKMAFRWVIHSSLHPQLRLKSTRTCLVLEQLLPLFHPIRTLRKNMVLERLHVLP